MKTLIFIILKVLELAGAITALAILAGLFYVVEMIAHNILGYESLVLWEQMTVGFCFTCILFLLGRLLYEIFTAWLPELIKQNMRLTNKIYKAIKNK